MKKVWRNFKLTILLFIFSVACIFASNFTGTICHDRSYLRGAGCTCDWTGPNKVGETLLCIGVLSFLGAIIVLVAALIRLTREGTKTTATRKRS